jgi:hypothetical protein
MPAPEPRASTSLTWPTSGSAPKKLFDAVKVVATAKVTGGSQSGAKPKRTVVPAGTLTMSPSFATLVHCWVADEEPVVMPAPVPRASTSLA